MDEITRVIYFLGMVGMVFFTIGGFAIRSAYKNRADMDPEIATAIEKKRTRLGIWMGIFGMIFGIVSLLMFFFFVVQNNPLQ
jgi:heme/copper-type cytochrome/quinol oxidase subunit 2